MIDINLWTEKFLGALDEAFPNRIYFVGLQGSYSRGEATDESDIDMVVILDELSAEDIAIYNKMLDTLPHRELICGFLSGKEELFRWESSDLLQFYYDTTPLKGSLDELLPLLDTATVERAVKIGACNIYHGCVHNMLHEKSEDALKGLYKAASFVVQAVALRQTGKYVKQKRDLLNVVSSDEKIIVENLLRIKDGCDFDFDNMSETLFSWSKKIISDTM